MGGSWEDMGRGLAVFGMGGGLGRASQRVAGGVLGGGDGGKEELP